MKVFLADRSPLLRQTLARLLCEVTGVEIVGQAADLKTTLAAISELQPNLILLDVHLMGKAGLDLLKAITREDEAPVVMVLADDVSTAYEKHCVDAGADFLIYKASGLEKALAIIQGLLRDSAAKKTTGGS